MRIVTNPGSNLDEDFAHAKDVDLLPQKIVVDGISHDTRNTIDFSQVDAWVKKASKHPVVQGTTEQECLEFFTRLAKKDKEILVVMSSRKIIGSHDAAVAAAKTLMR
ncbi:MAG TPA: DegV family protein, partial [Archangium sp.]